MRHNAPTVAITRQIHFSPSISDMLRILFSFDFLKPCKGFNQQPQSTNYDVNHQCCSPNGSVCFLVLLNTDVHSFLLVGVGLRFRIVRFVRHYLPSFFLDLSPPSNLLAKAPHALALPPPESSKMKIWAFASPLSASILLRNLRISSRPPAVSRSLR